MRSFLSRSRLQQYSVRSDQVRGSLQFNSGRFWRLNSSTVATVLFGNGFVLFCSVQFRHQREREKNGNKLACHLKKHRAKIRNRRPHRGTFCYSYTFNFILMGPGEPVRLGNSFTGEPRDRLRQETCATAPLLVRFTDCVHFGHTKCTWLIDV